MLRKTGFFVLAILASACASGGSDGKRDERAKAVQSELDRQPPRANIALGDVCKPMYLESVRETDPARFIGIAGAHVGGRVHRDEVRKGVMGTTLRNPVSCRKVTWDAALPVEPGPLDGTGLISIGRIILDKLGPDQQQMGLTLAPYEAHFEPSITGRALIHAGLASAPTTLRGSMAFSKDVDGKLAASNVTSL